MKTAVVTGAGSGIGRLTAEAFFGAGYRVALLGRRIGPLEELAAGHGDAALPISCDVADEAAVAAAFASVVAAFGRVDVVFNNAGIFSPGATIDETPVSTWKEVVDINLTGAFLVARAAFAAMRAQDPQGGRIINNGSISAYVPRPGSVPYTVTKHGITGLTRTLSLDGRPFGIACGQIDIGNALTDMAARMQDGVPQADGSVKPEPVMDARHAAEAVLHMAGLPLEANVQFMTVMASAMPFIGRG